MAQNYLNNRSPNSLIGQAEDYGQMPQREDYGTLPAQNKYGQFKFGGPLGGNEGILDKAFEVLPFVGDIRALDRAREAAQVKITPDLMGGVDVGIEDPYTAAFETATAMPAVGDVATLFKMGAMSLPGIIALMARKTDDVIGLARGPLRSQAGIIGSTGAKTADLAALTRAQELKASGASADDIYGQTRWWLDHPDGRPRFEIDDSAAKLNWPDDIGPGDRIPLGRLENNYTHPELYEAYPSTGDISLGATGNGLGGSYNPRYPMPGGGSKEVIDTAPGSLVHEIQHAVQESDNLARGGNPAEFPNVDNVFDQLNKNMDFLEGKFAQRIDSAKGDVKQLIKLRKENPEEYARITELMSRYEVNNVPDLSRALFDDWDKAERTITPEAQYQRLAGEAEARLAQRRRDMTMPERLAPGNEFYKKFDVPLEDQIVRMEGGVAQSADSLPIRPAKENLQTVIDSNTVGGRVVGDETVPIDSLSGGASASARGQTAVDKIAAQMAGTDGYIERLIVDQDGNVVEGAHRLEALRKLGIKDVPVTRISDPTANINVSAMEKAIRDVGSTPSDHVNRIVADVGEMLDEVGGDPAKVLEQYEFPAGFEDKYRAALSKAQSADSLPMGAVKK